MTGYTHDVPKGQSFEGFVWACARAFGALVHMRDDAIGAAIKEREPGTYYDEEIAKSHARLAELVGATPAQRRALYDADMERHRAFEEKYQAEKRANTEALTAMLTKVQAWTAPTPEHENLKAFMVQQLTDSIKLEADLPTMMPPPKSVDEWYIAEVGRMNDWIARTKTSKAEEVERCRKANEWMQALNRSVPLP